MFDFETMIWSIPVSTATAWFEVPRKPLRAAIEPQALRGPFEWAVLETFCVLANRQTEALCQTCIESCAVPKLVKLRSEIQKRTHPSPLRFGIEGDNDRGCATLVALGETAQRCLPKLRDSINHFVAHRLQDARGPIPATIVDCTWKLQTLGEICQVPWDGQSIGLFIASPLQTKSKTIAQWCGNGVHDLMQWALFDQRETPDKASCDAVAEGARAAVIAQVGELEISCQHVYPTKGDIKASRGHQGQIFISGLRGHVVLGGDLASAIRWLRLLSVWGVGRHRGLGMGQIKLHRQVNGKNCPTVTTG